MEEVERRLIDHLAAAADAGENKSEVSHLCRDMGHDVLLAGIQLFDGVRRDVPDDNLAEHSPVLPSTTKSSLLFHVFS